MSINDLRIRLSAILFFLIIGIIPLSSWAVTIHPYSWDSDVIHTGLPQAESGWTATLENNSQDRHVRSGTRVYSHGNPTDAEQLMLELVNASRSDPSGAALYYGIDLNQGLDPGTISTSPKQPLAFNSRLISSARSHSQWMLDTQTFSHTGQGGSSAGDRMEQAGYIFSGAWRWGENISWSGTTGSLNTESHSRKVIENLFLSPGHRKNTLSENYDEIGIGGLTGSFDGHNALMVTENFARSDSTPNPMIVGVVYNDLNGNNQYDMGEGIEGVTITPEMGSYHAVTSSSGGYAVPVSAAGGIINVSASGPGVSGTVTRQVSFQDKNVKLDFVLSDSQFPSPPKKVSPADGSSVSGSNVTFQWAPSSGATYYWIQVRPTDMYLDYVYEKVGNATTYTWNNAPADGSEIMWQVMAGNEAGDGHWSGFWYFNSNPSTPSGLPGIPGLKAPANGSIVAGTRADFSWSVPSGNPSKYHLQLSPDPDFASGVIQRDDVPVANPFVTDMPNDGTRYYWRVRAYNSQGWGQWSETWSFVNSGTGEDSEIIFNWLEGLFPEVLSPSPQPTEELNGILYRYYRGTNVFICTYQGGLYFIDHFSEVYYLGEVDYWLRYVN